MSRRRQRGRGKGKRTVLTADEVLVSGPFRIERFGRILRLSNRSTPEQHAAFLERQKTAHAEFLTDLAREVPALQDLVRKYNPVRLMCRATYMLLPVFIDHRSENEYSAEESHFLPAAEYLQYLIARTMVNPDATDPSDDEWNEVWQKAIEVLQLTQRYLVTRPTSTIPPTKLDELRFALDNRRLMVRAQRYHVFLVDHLRSALEPYEQQIQSAYGLATAAIAQGLNTIARHQSHGVAERQLALAAKTEALRAKLHEHGYAVGPDASEEETELTRAALKTEDFRSIHEDFQSLARLALTPALFDITDLTSLPAAFLSLLSVRPGESVLTTLTGPGHDDLSPLSVSELHQKPFLEVDGHFYSFYHSGLEDHVTAIVESDLFRRFPGQVSQMAKKRSNRLEADSRELLSSIIRPDFAHQNVYYPNPEDGQLTELDLLLGVDDLLFIVEAKAGGMSAGANRGAPSSVARDLSDLIIEGQRQSERAEKYIRSTEEVAFFDETAKLEVIKIRHSRFRRMFRVVVTREDLGWVGARLALLSILDPNLSKSFPWHVSLDDLRALAELFKGDGIRFAHYLDTRLLASSKEGLSQHDEIEHVGLYNKLNHYQDVGIEGADRISFDPSYMRDIDYYFAERASGDSPEVPTQSMPPLVRQFIQALGKSRARHRFEVGSAVLSLDSESRRLIEQGLEVLEAGRLEGRQKAARFPFSESGGGLTVSHASGAYWPEELRKSAVQMELAGCSRWLAVQVAQVPPYGIEAIETIAAGQFPDEALAPYRARNEVKARQTIALQRPGRNDTCPCGSGKKFKKCHGR